MHFPNRNKNDAKYVALLTELLFWIHLSVNLFMLDRPEEAEEQRDRDQHRDRIGDRFRYKDREHLVFNEIRQNINQRNQQDNLPQ